MPRPIRTIQLSETDNAELKRLVRSRTTAQRVVERCRIVLASAAGQKGEEICASVGVSKPTVKTWLDRFEASGIPGLLQDLPRSGRRSTVNATSGGPTWRRCWTFLLQNGSHARNLLYTDFL